MGVASLTATLGFKPLLGLQDSSKGATVNLKYFLDPLVNRKEDAGITALLHSKVIYLYNRKSQKSICYVGSHNWTSPALGGKGTRNAEASVRIEEPFQESHLQGKGASFSSKVNHHLMRAFNADACLNATEENTEVFEQWIKIAKSKNKLADVENATVLLAVLEPQSCSHNTLRGLREKGIYFPTFSETAFDAVENRRRPIYVLVWDSRLSLQLGRPPSILVCRSSTVNPGTDAQHRGSNQSTSPIEGFHAVLFDAEKSQGFLPPAISKCKT